MWPIACDMSSSILSKPVDCVPLRRHLCRAQQKNLAPAGLTVVIVDKSLAGKERPYTR
jgi:phosphoserine aminotransferase